MRSPIQAVLLAALALPLCAQAEATHLQGFPGLAVGHRPKVEFAWNRLYELEELYGLLDRLEREFPGFLTHEVIGYSVENREMRVYTLAGPAGDLGRDEPALWVDGNVHGNEVQGGEVVAYLAWYLLENYASNPRAQDFVDNTTLHLLLSVNPDGRARWFRDAHNAHSSRTGALPTDDDRDGRFDEDPPNDMDGDGSIVQMRKYTPGEGRFRLSERDPRILEPVPQDERQLKGDWTLLGSEGFDDDGDGRANEDSVGGYDMNRAWPSLWAPEQLQNGAGPYPLYWPETRAIARFISAHPRIGAVQSFHNAGGMILRGPGAEEFGEYPSADVRVYDELGRDGERMLPFYRYMVIWKDLYSVYGGFVNWTYEGLGIISFTNELWNSEQDDPNSKGPAGQEGDLWRDDALLLGAGFVDWHEVEHPLYGKVEIGGFKKDVGRVPPSFQIEEMLHRNALFCIRHGEELPRVEIDEPLVSELGDGLLAVDVVVRNTRLIPTRTARAAGERLGLPDRLSLRGKGLEVLASGIRRDKLRPEDLELDQHQPAELVLENGVPGRGEVRVRFFVRGSGSATLEFATEKARAQTRSFELGG